MESDLPEMRIATIPQWKFMASWYWKLLALGLPLEPNLIQFGGFQSMGVPHIIRVTDDHFSIEPHGDDWGPDPPLWETQEVTLVEDAHHRDLEAKRLGGEVDFMDLW